MSQPNLRLYRCNNTTTTNNTQLVCLIWVQLLQQVQTQVVINCGVGGFLQKHDSERNAGLKVCMFIYRFAEQNFNFHETVANSKQKLFGALTARESQILASLVLLSYVLRATLTYEMNTNYKFVSLHQRGLVLTP